MFGRLRRRGRPAAFALLAVFAEVAGRSITGRVDQALHVEPLAPKGAAYYPFLLVGVKVVAALALAAVLARLVRARAAADAGNRLLVALGHVHERRAPRLRPTISLRAWATAFAACSLAYLVQADTEAMTDGRWWLLSPWLHTYALPVFAALSVLVALAWSVAHWVREVEEYAVRTLARVRRILDAAGERVTEHAFPADDHGPRRRFGLAFESRPPPLPA
ncbi:MAG TPA: hypothetical protein VF186_10870 [Gaiellaceae bacterium]